MKRWIHMLLRVVNLLLYYRRLNIILTNLIYIFLHLLLLFFLAWQTSIFWIIDLLLKILLLLLVLLLLKIHIFFSWLLQDLTFRLLCILLLVSFVYIWIVVLMERWSIWFNLQISLFIIYAYLYLFMSLLFNKYILLIKIINTFDSN